MFKVLSCSQVVPSAQAAQGAHIVQGNSAKMVRRVHLTVLISFHLAIHCSIYIAYCTLHVKSTQVAYLNNAVCIEQRAAAKSKEAQVRVICLFLLHRLG